jgi:hypothetical protein
MVAWPDVGRSWPIRFGAADEAHAHPAGRARSCLRTGSSGTPGEQEIKLEGTFLEVIDDRKLVMTIPNGPEYAEVTIVFTGLGDRTEITSSTPVPAQAKQMVEKTTASILGAVAAIAESL